MRVGFIGLGRMGHGMATRVLNAGHDLAIYDQISSTLETLGAAGASVADSVAQVVADRELVISMLPHDEALEELAFSEGGLLKSMAKGTIHMPSGTHGIDIIRRLTVAHKHAGQILVAGHVLGRPDLAAEGELTIIPGGPQKALEQLQPIFDVLAKRTFITGDEPQPSTAVKIANNFVLGSATEGLFGAPAFQVYGQIIVEEQYDKVGASVQIGLKDANLALAAGEAVNVPLPCANVWRDRLLGARAHGDGDLDWAVMAREQARASGIE